MLKFDKDSLICDLAETYHIYDYKSLPPRKVATFSIGLGDNSRIKRKMRGDRVNMEHLLLATLIDQMSALLKANMEGGASIPSMVGLLNGTETKPRLGVYASPEEYEEARRLAIEKGGI